MPLPQFQLNRIAIGLRDAYLQLPEAQTAQTRPTPMNCPNARRIISTCHLLQDTDAAMKQLWQKHIKKGLELSEVW